MKSGEEEAEEASSQSWPPASLFLLTPTEPFQDLWVLSLQAISTSFLYLAVSQECIILC